MFAADGATDSGIPARSDSTWIFEPGLPRPGPALVHQAKRRCAVWNGTPDEGGRSRHAHPLVSTYTIAVNTWRSGSGAVPPPRGRAGTAAGAAGPAPAAHRDQPQRQLISHSHTVSPMNQATRDKL